MKKHFLFLSLFIFLAIKGFTQNNSATLRYVDEANNKVEAALIINAIEKADFDEMEAVLKKSVLFTIESNYYSDKKIAIFTFKPKATSSISDFENLIIQAKITQIVYNSKAINSSQISENYTPINRSETKNNINLKK